MQALIIAGGSGTRFWPASRRKRPKQLLPLLSDRSLLRLTVDRLLPLFAPAEIWVCTARELGEEVRRQLPEVPAEQILLEPEGRNTAAAIGWSLASMPAAKRSEVVVSLHSDHWMEDEAAFRETLSAAVELARGRRTVVALGVPPRWAETGYGYLEIEAAVGSGAATAHRVVRFREKPDAATAAAFAESGRHLWNAGIFVFPGDLLLERLLELEPDLGAVVTAAAEPERLDRIYASLPALPIDTAVMERLEELYTLILDCGWNDLGSWEALAAVLQDGEENQGRGRTLAVDARDNLLWADGGTVAVLGVQGLAVVLSGDAVLVLPKERSQEVRRIVAELKRRGADDLL